MESLKYPIGKFDYERPIADAELSGYIRQIEELPSKLIATLNDLNTEQLDTPYRPEGWTVRQVVHHLADSHMNAYIRLNLMLTEDSPTIKPYKENLWAELAYKQQLDLNAPLVLITNIHFLIVTLLRTTTENDYSRSYIHPEYQRVYSLKQVIALYAWHGNHHHTHITRLLERNFDK